MIAERAAPGKIGKSDVFTQSAQNPQKNKNISRPRSRVQGPKCAKEERVLRHWGDSLVPQAVPFRNSPWRPLRLGEKTSFPLFPSPKGLKSWPSGRYSGQR